MTISFYQRGTTIYCRVHHGSNMIRVSTGIKVPTHVKFAKDKFSGGTSEVASLNAELSRQKTIINELYSEYNGNLTLVRESYMTPELDPIAEEEDYDLLNLAFKYIDGMTDGTIKTRQKERFRESSCLTYRFAARTLGHFYQAFGSMDLNEFNLEGRSLKEKQILSERFANYFDRFSDHMLDSGLGMNSRRDVLNILSIIVNYQKERLFLNLPKVPSLTLHECPIIVLQPEFLKKFVMDEHKLYETFKAEYKYMWEVISTMLVTSFRISDAVLLTKDDFTFRSGDVFLVKENQKTGEDTEMPLPKALTDVYMKNLTHHQSIYTPITQYDKARLVRSGIKEFFMAYPEMHEMVTVKQVDPRGKKVAVTKRLYEWVHPHMLRKTAITTMLVNNVSPDHVKFASGHKTTSNSFNRYVGFVERHYKSQINDYHKKMFS